MIRSVKGEKNGLDPVCTKNLIRIDWLTESPNVTG
jgi:hypothetical protein